MATDSTNATSATPSAPGKTVNASLNPIPSEGFRNQAARLESLRQYEFKRFKIEEVDAAMARNRTINDEGNLGVYLCIPNRSANEIRPTINVGTLVSCPMCARNLPHIGYEVIPFRLKSNQFVKLSNNNGNGDADHETVQYRSRKKIS